MSRMASGTEDRMISNNKNKRKLGFAGRGKSVSARQKGSDGGIHQAGKRAGALGTEGMSCYSKEDGCRQLFQGALRQGMKANRLEISRRDIYYGAQ